MRSRHPRTFTVLRFAAAVGVLLSPLAMAEEEGWQTLSHLPVHIRQRPVGDTPVTELEADALLRAPVEEIEEVLLDFAGQAAFMPYIRECRPVGPPEDDGARIIYTRIAPPLVANRDYVVRLTTSHPTASSFRQTWTSAADAVPIAKDVVRLRIIHGSWDGTARDGRTSLAYHLVVEPGAGVSPVIVRWTNKSAVTDLFAAIEKEAQRRARVRTEKAAAAGPRVDTSASSAAPAPPPSP